jgi:hypothetical protein
MQPDEPQEIDENSESEQAAEDAGVIKGVEEWLDKGGYPLEFQVEEAFRRAGFDVRRGVHYTDEEKGEPKRREIDVVALRSGVIPVTLPNGEPWKVRVILAFFVESKHASPPDVKGHVEDKLANPWVAFTSPRHCYPEPGRFVLPVVSSLGQYAFYSLTRDRQGLRLPMFRIPKLAAFSVAHANAPKGDSGPSYAALHTAIKAAYSWIPEPSGLSFPGELFIGFPVVVTDNHLVECSFEDRSFQDRQENRPLQRRVQTCKQIRVYWHGSTVAASYTSVDVVTLAGLDRYATTMFRGCEDLIKLLEDCLHQWATEILSSGNIGELSRRLWEFENG